jgi:hypothetical protein
MTAADGGEEPPSAPNCPLQSAGSSSEKRTGMVPTVTTEVEAHMARRELPYQSTPAFCKLWLPVWIPGDGTYGGPYVRAMARCRPTMPSVAVRRKDE